MKTILTCVAASWFAVGLHAGDTNRVVVRELTNNVKVVLLAARTSQRRGQNLEATFRRLDGNTNDTIFVAFPAHSHTTHEKTIMQIIRSATPHTDRWGYEWANAAVQVIFSIPKDNPRDFSRWWFVDITGEWNEGDRTKGSTLLPEGAAPSGKK